MSVTATCHSCGRQYQAPDAMAGRRVRCKNCGETFQIPRLAGEDEDFDQLAELEKTFGGDASLRTQSGSDEDDNRDAAEASNADGDDESEERGEADVGRRSQPLPFAGASVIDSLLPPGLVILSLLMLWLTSSVDPPNYGLQAIRFGVAFLAFVLIIAPLTNLLIGKAASSLGYQLPPSAKWRGFASYLPALAIGVAMWNVGDGNVTALVLGSFVGVAVSTGFLYLLFRLRPAEIAPSSTYAAGGFFIGLFVAAGLVFGFDLLTKNLLISNKKVDNVFAVSPLGPGLPWITDEDRLALAPPKPTTKPGKVQPNGKPGSGSGTPTLVANDPAKPAPTSPGSKLVLSNDPTPIPAGFDQVIRPLTESDFLAVVRRKDNTDTLELWNNSTWTQRGTAVLTRDDEHPYVLSADGERIARIVSFPRAAILISGFTQDRPVETRDLDLKQGIPQLIGFAGESRLLVRWNQNDKCAVEVIDATSHQKSKMIEAPWFELNNNTFAVAADGSVAGVAAKVDGLPTISVFDLTTGFAVSKLTVNSLDPRWPVAPRGFSFSPDARKLAILFEQSGAGLVICYSIDKAKGSMFEITEHVYPAGPIPGYDAHGFNGDALSWMPDNRSWLLYGVGVFDQTSGRQVGDLGVPNVQDAHVVIPDTVELLVAPGGISRSLTQLKLNGANLSALTTPAKAP